MREQVSYVYGIGRAALSAAAWAFVGSLAVQALVVVWLLARAAK